MKIVNLTPHTINIYVNGDSFAISPSGKVARVLVKPVHTGHLNVDTGDKHLQVPVFRNSTGRGEVGLEWIPPMVQDTIYLVSGVVLEALKDADRFDIYAPDTGPTAIRDSKGQIIGVTQLLSNEF